MIVMARVRVSLLKPVLVFSWALSVGLKRKRRLVVEVLVLVVVRIVWSFQYVHRKLCTIFVVLTSIYLSILLARFVTIRQLAPKPASEQDPQKSVRFLPIYLSKSLLICVTDFSLRKLTWPTGTKFKTCCLKWNARLFECAKLVSPVA